jgi:uracil-DNA glycosylase
MKIPLSWCDVVGHERDLPYFASLAEFLQHERQHFNIFPAHDQVFTALELTATENVKVVIVGQDPYHGVNQAHGLSFSVQRGVAIPPSLRNIFVELHTDTNTAIPEHGCLDAWAAQGVLLLNTTLTVREGQAGSHAGHGWEQFTDAIIHYLGSRDMHTVFVLWGAHAQRKLPLINGRHTVITSAHPSPLSAYRGFIGSRPFSQINSALSAHGQPTIDWRLDS